MIPNKIQYADAHNINYICNLVGKSVKLYTRHNFSKYKLCAICTLLYISIIYSSNLHHKLIATVVMSMCKKKIF